MKQIINFILFSLFFPIFSCSDTVPTTDTDKPFALGGINQSATIGKNVILDGAGSYDLKSKSLSYSWTFSKVPPVAGSALTNQSFTPLNSEASIVQFSPDASGNYDLVLTVSNGKKSDTDNVIISVGGGNASPTAVAGPDQTVPVSSPVTLDGSNSTDPEYSILTYSWTFSIVPPVTGSSLSNSSLTSISSDKSVITFTPDVVGSFVVKLTVTDSANASDSDLVVVSAYNSTPVSNAGTNKTGASSVTVGSAVLLDGSGSSDANGDTLTFLWTFTSIPPVSGSSLTNASISSRSSNNSLVQFTPDVSGNYVLELTVTDPGGLSGTDTMIVQVN